MQNIQFKLPRCNSCKYLNQKSDVKAFGGYLCNSPQCLQNGEGSFNIRIRNIDNYGCIHHSSYEGK